MGRGQHKVLPPGEVRRRRQQLGQILAPYYGSKPEADRAVRFFMETAHLSPEKVASRVERMKAAGVPMTGLLWKIGRNQGKFDRLIARFERLRGLTRGDAVLAAQLFRKGVSKEVIGRMVKQGQSKGCRFKWVNVKAKIDFFEAVRLDQQLYGTSKIPVSAYEGLLDKPMCIIRRGFERQVLWPLKDAHASMVLDMVLPGWRESKSLKLNMQRPAATLEKYRAAKAVGIKPTFYLLSTYSAEAIRAGKARTNRKKSAKGAKQPE